MKKDEISITIISLCDVKQMTPRRFELKGLSYGLWRARTILSNNKYLFENLYENCVLVNQIVLTTYDICNTKYFTVFARVSRYCLIKLHDHHYLFLLRTLSALLRDLEF